jgi:hypothetical protein
MKMTEVKAKAKSVGVEPGKMKKDDLIRAVQKAEGYNACFGTEAAADCQQTACCFMMDCKAE